VVFDCGAVAPSLIAAELFGAERGAYTGADRERAGLFEEADGGTLFLDEIGELPLDVQPTLLGAIERKASRRVGGRTEIRHDVRIIAATNRNLSEQVRLKKFREDLFFRLAVARLRIPPLRERPEDIRALATMFAADAGQTLPASTLDLCAAHDWPGNVRELRNTVEHLLVMPESIDNLRSRGKSTKGSDPEVFEAPGKLRSLPAARHIANENFERHYLEAALELAGGNVTRAAELCQVARPTLSVLVQKHGLGKKGR
jgi:DNA-binding NtrC family response regulator